MPVAKNKNAVRGLQPLTSLSKGLSLLLQLREASSPMSLSEISRTVGLHKVTTLRLLFTSKSSNLWNAIGRRKLSRLAATLFMWERLPKRRNQTENTRSHEKISAQLPAHRYLEHPGRHLRAVHRKAGWNRKGESNRRYRIAGARQPMPQGERCLPGSLTSRSPNDLREYGSGGLLIRLPQH